MICSHRHKFMFFCNGKTGTTSLEAGLGRYDESSDLNGGAPRLWANKHIPPAVAKSFFPKELWDDYFKFVFVRHPLHWVISQLRHNFKSFDFTDGKKVTCTDVDFLFQHLRSYRGLPFAPSLLQSNYVYDVDGDPVVDFVGRFEALAVDVEEIRRKIGIDFELPHLNRSALPRRYEGFFDAETAEYVRELWQVDFDNFGYALNDDLFES